MEVQHIIEYSMVKLYRHNNRHKIAYYNRDLFLIHTLSFADHMWTYCIIC